jgi:hypothetical protein
MSKCLPMEYAVFWVTKGTSRSEWGLARVWMDLGKSTRGGCGVVDGRLVSERRPGPKGGAGKNRHRNGEGEVRNDRENRA